MIRRAELPDVPSIVPHLQEFSMGYGTAAQLFPDLEMAEYLLNDLVLHEPFWVAEEGGEIVGLIAGTLGPHPYNADIVVLQEMFWWVMPAYRGRRAGYELLKAFTDFGAEHATWTVMTLEHNSPVNDRVLLKQGYRMWERNYLRES